MSTDRRSRREFFGIAGGLAAGAALAVLAPAPAVPQALCRAPFEFIDGALYCSSIQFSEKPGRVARGDIVSLGGR